MKTIGLIGGMSWESSLEYYRLLNEKVSKRIGGLNSAKVIMYSVNFGPIEKLQKDEKWKEIGLQIMEIEKKLEKAGADFILICANTTHHIADMIEKAIDIPLLHISNATATAIKHKDIDTIGLLGTIYTSRYPYFQKKLESAGISVVIPNQESIEFINNVIYKELCHGVILENSKKEILRIIETLNKEGVKGIVLACTELPLLITPNDVTVPLFNTLEIHIEAAVTLAIKNDTI